MFGLDAPDAIITGAILATTGWVYTGRRSRMLARKQHTINIMLKGNFDEGLRTAHKRISDYIRGQKPLPAPDADEHAELIPHLRLILNHYEFIAAGIRKGDLDEALVLDAERGTILNAYEKSEIYIFTLRDNRRNQAIYEHLEWLHKRWEKKPPGACARSVEWCRGKPFYGHRNSVRD